MSYPILFGTMAASGGELKIPQTISGLHFWYDASDLDSITSSSGLVSQWNDKSGNGYHVTSSGSLRPTLTSNYLNNKSVITFNGTQYMQGNVSLTSNAFTHFIVMAKTSAASGATEYGRSLSLWNSGVGNDYADVQAFEVHWFSTATWSGVTGPGAGPYRNGSSIAATPLSIGAAHLGVTTLNGSTVEYRLDDATVSGTTSATSMNSNRQTIGAGGASGGGDQYLIGWIAESIMYNRVLTSTEITTISNYLKEKWNSGLVLYYDAGNSSSYSGSGSTWYNLLGSSRELTLVNSPSFTSNGTSSYFRFNGSNQYAQSSNMSNVISGFANVSANIWYRPLSIDNNGMLYDFNNQSSSNRDNLAIRQNWGGGNTSGYTTNSNNEFTSVAFENSRDFLNIWRNYTQVRRNNTMYAYVNGQQVGSVGISGNIRTTSHLRLGDDILGTNALNADFAVFQTWSRALSDAEVLANFNQFKSRYGY
jgi:hypothetical protein